MKRLLVVFTGGTIASGFDGQGKGPVPRASNRLKSSLSEFFTERGAEAVFCEPFGTPGLDSSELDPGHWLIISRSIAEELKNGLSGVLVLHGTDTMAYTAAWLSLCFGNLPIPIILTGSQLTLDYMPEDVTSNMRGAATACFSDLHGVWVYFYWKLIPGDRAHKAHAMHPDAFTATNGQCLFFNSEWALESANRRDCISVKGPLTEEIKHLLMTSPEEVRKRCSRIGWGIALPGASPLLPAQGFILCLLGYGAGNITPSILDRIEHSYDAGRRPLIVACSQAEGGMKQPEGYNRVGMARLAQKGFRVWSQMDRTIEFVHSLCCYALSVEPASAGNILSRFLKEVEA